MTYFDQVAEAAAFLKARLASLSPRIGIVLGSGLGAVADAVAGPVVVPYAEIPHFPTPLSRATRGGLSLGAWAVCRSS